MPAIIQSAPGCSFFSGKKYFSLLRYHRGFMIVALLAIAAASVLASDITGTITVKQRLTHPSVTAPVSMYERGPAVALGKDKQEDPLASERARVVVWIEGNGS